MSVDVDDIDNAVMLNSNSEENKDGQYKRKVSFFCKKLIQNCHGSKIICCSLNE